MLFSKVFNWLRYKTLPPSFLFLNRLFLERDSKHRRVMSNLGLTFRNSKWSPYARTNVTIADKRTYLNLALTLFGLLVALLVTLNFNSLYDSSWVQSRVAGLLWFITDADLYLKTALTSSFICLVHTSLMSLRAKILPFNETPMDSPSTVTLTNSGVRSLTRRHKSLLYVWLTNNLESDQFDSLYDAKSSLSPTLYKSLFSLSFLLNQSTAVHSNQQFETRNTLSPSSDFQMLSLEFELFKSKDNFQQTRSFNTMANWSLSSIHTELSHTNPEITTPKGLFYMPDFSTAQLNRVVNSLPELSPLKTSVDNQLTLIRWNRWLYKYSVLHRSSIKAAARITDAKKLLNTGFYDSSLFSRNLWASPTLGTSSDSETTALLGSLHRSLYGDYRNLYQISSPTLTPGSNYLATSNVKLLNFYESSYYWWAQRAYSVLSLGSDSAIFKPQLNTLSSSNLLHTSTNAANAHSKASLPVEAILSNSVSPFRKSGDLTLGTPLNTPSTTDVYLNYYDRTLFSKVRVEMTKSLLQNKSQGDISTYSPRRI